MRAVIPTGAMSRKNITGSEEQKNRWGGHEDFVVELNLFHKAKLDDPMPESAQRMSFSALKVLMNRAEEGTLQFRDEPRRDETSPCEADTIKMQGCQHLIELRETLKKNQKTRFGQPKRVMRLYYFEPQFGGPLSTVSLCGLHIASKPADEADVYGEQDAAIIKAASRSVSWFQDEIEASERRKAIEATRSTQ